MVGSIDLEYHTKDPTISCILLISCFDSGDDVSSGVGRCTFDPYIMGAAFAGACCGFGGTGCWNLWSLFLTNPGTLVSSVLLL